MPKFENKYCYCTWEDCLVGKKVFFADTISVLKKIVENNDQDCYNVVVENHNEDFQFYIDGYGRFAFCYWDPNYEFKVAFEQGKTIQGFFRAIGEWCDMPDPSWVDDIQYRIKPEQEPKHESEPKKEEFNIETEISLFDKKYVHKVWIDELKGKKAFFADYEDDLERFVEEDNRNFYGTIVRLFGDGRFPFQMEDGGYYAFCYCDPYLELKTAFKQGKTIQALMPSNTWEDVKNPKWCYPPEEYRIKPEPELEKEDVVETDKYGENLVTCRQLAEWLARGNGEYKMEGIHRCYYEYWYHEDDSDVLVSEKAWVRKWGEKTWYKPTRQYLGLN